jgi:hypothetical protein
MQADVVTQKSSPNPGARASSPIRIVGPDTPPTAVDLPAWVAYFKDSTPGAQMHRRVLQALNAGVPGRTLIGLLHAARRDLEVELADDRARVAEWCEPEAQP